MKKFKKGCGVVCIGLAVLVVLIALASSGAPPVDDVVGPTGITDPFVEVEPSATSIPATSEPAIPTDVVEPTSTAIPVPTVIPTAT